MAGLERGALREALLNEVRAVCAEDGAEAVSITKIGKRLGVSSGAPFRIFPSREHIFAALIESEMDRLNQTFEDIWSTADRDPLALLSAICQAYIDHAWKEPAMFRLSFSVSAKAMGAVNLQKLGEDVYDKVRRAVAACLPADASTDLIEARSYILWSTIHGHVMLRMTGQMDDQNIQITDAVFVESAVQNVVKSG